MTWRELWRMWVGKRSDAWDRAASVLSMLSADNVSPSVFHPFERHNATKRSGSTVRVEYNADIAKQMFAPFNRT